MRKMIAFCVCMAMLILACFNLYAQTISVPSDYATIQEAINASSNGDTVLVSDGTYAGSGNDNITLNGKEIVVKSLNGPDQCIIDGSSAGDYAAGFVSGYVPVSNDAVIEGFTIENFNLMGVYIFGSSPVIKKNRIRNCNIAISCSGGSRSIILDNEIAGGGNLDLASSRVQLINNLITGNTVTGTKAGIIRCSSNDTSYIANNVIRENLGCAIYLDNAHDVQIMGNEINGNVLGNLTTFQFREYDDFNRPFQLYTKFEQVGGAIYVNGKSSADIRNNLIINNQAGHTAGIFCEEGSEAAIVNNTLLNNASFTGGSITTLNPSSVIMNNIIASPGSIDPGQRLERWFYNNLVYQIEYEAAKRKAVHYYYGFWNNGEAGELSITGNWDTTFTILAGEHIWLEATSIVVANGDGGGIDLTIRLGDESIKLDITMDGVYNGGCIGLYDEKIQSFGVQDGGLAGAGIVTIGPGPFNKIEYNNFYASGGNGQVWQNSNDLSEMNIINLPDDHNNISIDPLISKADFSLLDGSPCIDAGNPEIQYNDGGLPPGLGTSRNDLGVYGGPFNTEIDGFASAGCTVTYSTINESACGSYDFNGKILDASGTYYDTLTNDTGCDSIVALNLTVTFVDISVAKTGSTLASNAGNATYQWLDCNNDMAPIPGAENQMYAPDLNGSYAVVVTQDGCVDTSLCHIINTTDIEKGLNEGAAFIYPNPTSGNLAIDLGKNPGIVSVIFLNALGEEIKSFTITDHQLINMTIEGSPGLYLLKFHDADGYTIVKKVIKK